MNQNQIYTIVSTIVLTGITAFVAGANSKFTFNKATHLFYTKGGVCTGFDLTGAGMSGTLKLTTGGVGFNASLLTTTSGSTYSLFNTRTCTSVHRIHAITL
jgi:hypothetical protein